MNPVTLCAITRAPEGRFSSPARGWLSGYFRACALTRDADKHYAAIGLTMLVDLARHCPYEPVRRRAQQRANEEMALIGGQAIQAATGREVA